MRTLRAMLRYAWYTAVTLAVISLWGRMFGFDPVGYAYAAFNAPPQAWTAAYELDPTATDPVSQGDDHLRAVKTEVRDRAETEHQWGSGLGLVTTDTGRHLFGSARVFFQTAAPPVTGAVGDLCLTEADRDGNRFCDAGRLWLDQDGADNVALTADDGTLNVSIDTDADLDADLWFPIRAPSSVPAGALIMWDQTNVCPSGYAEATEYRNIQPIGADLAAGDTGVPDNAGVSCTGAAAPAGCGSAGGTANYNFVQDTNELAAHTHLYQDAPQTLAGGGVALSTTDGANVTATSSTGGGQTNYGPIRTVLFCRKS